MKNSQGLSRFSNKRMFILSVLLTVLLLAFPMPVPAEAASDLTAPNPQTEARFEPGPCLFTLPAGWVEGVDVECGFLVVPEEYDDPQGATIRLAVAIVRSKDPNPQPDPLVMLQGGPGGSTIDTYSQILPTRQLLPGNRDIVLFDQRGTLYSEPALTCPEFLELTIETLDQDIPDEESYQMTLDSLQDCRDRLVSEGVNLDAFDSLENAADIESLRTALGYEQINLYGVSYGTLLALHAMRDFPEGLRTVILDSVVPTQTNFITGAPLAENRSFEALFESCRNDSDCNAAYPNLRGEFYGLSDRLNENPANLEVTDLDTGETHDLLLDGDSFLSTIFQMMYNSDLIPLIPRTIFDARDGSWGFLERILSFIVFDRTMSEGMYYSVVCAEDADFTLEDYDLTGLPEQLRNLEDDSAAYMLDACALWDVDPLGPQVDEPVVSDIPTLIVTGSFDPITPPSYAEQAAEGLENSFLFVFPSGGHGEVGSFDCADQIMLDFLDNPTTEPDATCINEIQQVEFATPASLVRLPVLAKLLNLEDGTGWQAIVYLVALLFLLSALLVYPLVWLVRLFTKKPAAQPAYGPETGMGLDQGTEVWGSNAPAQPEQKSMLYRLAPWLSGLAAGALLLFTGIFIAVVVNLVVENDMRVLLGLPGQTRILFVLPLIAAVLVLLMLAAAFAGWARKAGSVWGKLYLTLISLAGLTCIAVLAVWGLLTALIA